MQKIKSFFTRVWDFLRKHKWSVLLILMAMGVGGFFVYDSFTATTPFIDSSIIIPERKSVTVKAALSGLEISEDQSKKRPIAVVIENHPDARPQSGLNEADLIFETTAEGGITRFLAIYQSKEPEKIGPVRSARNYFVEWADSYDALFVHVGGSREAISLIDRIDIDDLNQFYFGSYFWRDSSRYAPHNVYTTLDKLREAAKNKGFPTEKEDIPSYVFKEEDKETLYPAAHKFTINFNASFAPTYTYVPESNHYKRSILGVTQTDAITKKPIIAKNVVVCFSNLSTQVIRRVGYTIIDTTDTGVTYYYVDGAKKIGKWVRTAGDPIRFYDANGKIMVFNPGTTWIDFVAKGTIVK